MATLNNVSPAARQELDKIAKLFQVSDTQVVAITKALGEAFHVGLQKSGQAVVMSPSYVTHLADGTEKGSFLALDIQWRDFGVSKITLDGKKTSKSVTKRFPISKDMMKSSATEFFGYMAKSVGAFVQQNSLQNEGLSLGFCFPFAAQMNSLGSATLLGWSKGFNIKNAVGQDVVKLLQGELDKAGVPVKCTALINDTVASMLSESYLTTPCVMSTIFGVGTNGAYGEDIADIKKLQLSPAAKGSQMLMNTEWGAFSQSVLNRNHYDEQLDQSTSNPGGFFYQKMVAWLNLGELIRIVLVSLVERSPSLLFNGVATDKLQTFQGFDTFNMCKIEEAKDISSVKKLVAELFEYSPDQVTDQDAEIVLWACKLVGDRAAKLSACPIAAVLIHLGFASLDKIQGGQTKLHIAADGEMFFAYPGFESLLRKSLGAIVGEKVEKQAKFIIVQDAGAIGAALAAYAAKGQ
ncbi:hypothetical protein B0H34DRAFT_685503 [Crassisporium funariophilum]|nr:hypothetical protein B0H34DRAFT_685503 [Crassisporium funariophilum]